jgi:hypothetical protein
MSPGHRLVMPLALSTLYALEYACTSGTIGALATQGHAGLVP